MFLAICNLSEALKFQNSVNQLIILYELLCLLIWKFDEYLRICNLLEMTTCIDTLQWTDFNTTVLSLFGNLTSHKINHHKWEPLHLHVSVFFEERGI